MTVTVRWFDEVESTNLAARDDRFGHGDVLATNSQTAGRGRLDRIWSMAPGLGVAMTVVLSRTEMGNPVFVTRIPLLVAVELRRLLVARISQQGPAPTVKWPNDVQIRGRKVAGILVEVLDVDRLAVGVGINLSGVPRELDQLSVTSLADEGIALSAEEVVDDLAEAIVTRARDLDADSTLTMLSESLDTIGQAVRLELPDGGTIVGRAVEIGPSGSIRIDVAGDIEEFVAADVTHLRLDVENTDSIG